MFCAVHAARLMLLRCCCEIPCKIGKIGGDLQKLCSLPLCCVFRMIYRTLKGTDNSRSSSNISEQRIVGKV